MPLVPFDMVPLTAFSDVGTTEGMMAVCGGRKIRD